MMVLVDMNERV